MTDKEWLTIGYTNGLITHSDCEEITFRDAYREWFKMKMDFLKRQSLDRIECTYNRYYNDCELLEKCISKITEADIITFLKRCCLMQSMTYREIGRIMQIIKSVLVYMRDIDKGGCPLYDWERIKRNLPMDKLESGYTAKRAIPKHDIECFLDSVINDNIYPEKRSACLCLCLNFYLGLRVGELSALTFDDFDLEKDVVRIYKTESKFYERNADGEKTGAMVYRVTESTKTIYSVREVPLVPEAVYIRNLIELHHIRSGYNSPYLAYDGKQTVLSRSLDRTLRRLLKMCDIRPFKTHDIRKAFATMMHHNGVPTRIISDLMGHSEIATTENCYIQSYSDNYDMYRQYMKQSLTYTLS